jgi:hypothetical protein
MINTSSETKNVFWRQRMNDWKTSGLNQRAYCTVNNISLVTFGYWRKKFQAEEEKINGKMIPILLTESHSNQENNVILDSIYVHLKSGISIEISLSLSDVTISRILRLLETVSC